MIGGFWGEERDAHLFLERGLLGSERRRRGTFFGARRSFGGKFGVGCKWWIGRILGRERGSRRSGAHVDLDTPFGMEK